MLRWTAIAFLCVAIALALDFGSSWLSTCYYAVNHQGSPKNPVENCSIYQGFLLKGAVWFANAFEKHGESVIAAFTIVLAASTIGLWLATKALFKAGERQIEIAKTAAEAAERQARTAESAFTKLERPYVFIFGVSKLEISRDRPLNQQPHVKYAVANYGKTPATIESIYAGIGAHDKPLAPLQIDYIDDPSHSLLAAPILDAGERRDGLTVEAPAGIDFEPADESYAGTWKPVPQLTGQDQLFVWIIIKYRGPFTNGHESSACWRYYTLSNRLIAHGGEQYNYTK